MTGLKKVLDGVIRFRKTIRKDLVKQFESIRDNPNPTAVFFTCTPGYEVSVTTEPAALELAVKRGKVKYVIVCGHSDCKAINTLYNLFQSPDAFDPTSPMDHWLRRHGHIRFLAIIDPSNQYNTEDKLSQINTLQQLTNIASHGFLKEYLETGAIHLHAMWFDVYTGEMYLFSRRRQQFVLVDEASANQLLNEEKLDQEAFTAMLKQKCAHCD